MSFLRRTSFALVYALCMQALTGVKLCFILGSKMAFFSFNQCLTPVMGFFTGTTHNLLIFGFRTAFAFFTMDITLSACTYHLPTLSGTLYLTTHSRIVRLALPLLCIIFFIMHPVGAKSMLYTVYWIPPVLMAFYKPRSIFLQAVGSTLTTHAVGSVFWLYTHQTNPLFWHSLLSVVWMERLLFALFMTATYYGATACYTRVNTWLDVRLARSWGLS